MTYTVLYHSIEKMKETPNCSCLPGKESDEAPDVANCEINAIRRNTCTVKIYREEKIDFYDRKTKKLLVGKEKADLVCKIVRRIQRECMGLVPVRKTTEEHVLCSLTV